MRCDDPLVRFLGAVPLPQLCALVSTGGKKLLPQSPSSSAGRLVNKHLLSTQWVANTVLGAGESEGPGDTTAEPLHSDLQRGHGPAPARLSALPPLSFLLPRSTWLQQHPPHACFSPIPAIRPWSMT